MFKRKVALTAAAAAAALCLAGGAAFAAVSATPIADTNGTAGYGALAPGVQYFNNVQSTDTPNQYAHHRQARRPRRRSCPPPRPRVCATPRRPGVANLDSTFAIQYGLGTAGTVANPCPVGGALATGDRHTFTGLGSVANTDDVWVSINVGNNCKIRHGNRHHQSWSYPSAGATGTATTP